MGLFNNQKSVLSKIMLSIKKDKLISAGDNVVIALSGGADSVFLAVALLALREKLKINLSACHYNHKLRGEEGDADEIFVRKFCADRDIDLVVGERSTSEEIKSEDGARELRYKFFEKVSNQKGIGVTKIAIAHHMDDVAETYLMRLIRGSGLKGLSSILPRRKNFIRPLLSISKNEILDYLKLQQIPFCQDSSNFKNDYFRNQIRNILMPQLLSHNPRLVNKISETAQSTSLVYDYLESETEKLFASMVTKNEKRYKIDAGDFSQLHPAIKTQLVIYCIDKLGCRDYTFRQITKIIQLIDQNVGNKILPLPYSLRFELKSGKIYLYKQESVNTKEYDGKPQKK